MTGLEQIIHDIEREIAEYDRVIDAEPPQAMVGIGAAAGVNIRSQRGRDAMTIDTLERRLDKALFDFSEDMRSQYDEESARPATHADISECARQAFYVMFEMKKSIIAYLKENGS